MDEVKRNKGKPTHLCVQLTLDSKKVLLVALKSLLELIDSSAGINELLLTGEERMALGANFDSDLFSALGVGRTGGHGLTASAPDDDFFIVGMDSLFHCLHLSFTAFSDGFCRPRRRYMVL